MGQKTHPTGLRVGVNQAHHSTWFANYGAYSETLKEDYKIRKFFEKEFDSIYSKAGISKLEIHRKVNQIELIVHAARPKAIAADTDQNSLINVLKDKLTKVIGPSKQFRVKVLQVAKSENESLLVARALGDQLEKRVAFRKVVRQTAQKLKENGVKGFKIQIAGRLNGAEIARADWVREGRVPLQTLRANISYSTYRANTIYGVLGIKVWIFDKEII